MPYNTRRKSLSLPSLGIHVPSASRSSSHRSPPTATPGEQPPAKKIKRSHSSESASPQPVTPPRNSTIKFEDEGLKSAGRVAENTPPPSPGGVSARVKVDVEGIDDDIVVGVIQQLEKTGNRPHSLKELAAVLSNTLPIVESSANPSAIISSRLATYLKRSWTALSPCPVEKELVGTQPKRVYYYLTTRPHQPIPLDTPAPTTVASRIISPSLSSAADEEEERDIRARIQLSPSPEVDLSSPEFEDDSTPFSNPDTHPPTSTNMSHNRRAQSPPLERDEREFTQTASSLQQRRSLSQEAPPVPRIDAAPEPDAMDIPVFSTELDETEESAAIRNREAAAALFGHVVDHPRPHLESSPVIKAQPHSTHTASLPSKRLFGDFAADAKLDVHIVDDASWGYSELKSPENVELDELDDLFGGY